MKASWNIGMFVGVASLIACGDGGGTTGGDLATLEAFDNGLTLPVDGTISVSSGALAVGEEDDVSEIRLINTGSATLVIDEITIDSVPAGVFRLAGDRDGGAMPAFPIRVEPEDALEGNDRVEEIARMLGGLTVTKKTRDVAAELLRSAQA